MLDTRWPSDWHVKRKLVSSIDQHRVQGCPLPGSYTLLLMCLSSSMQECQWVTGDWIIYGGPACPHSFVNVNEVIVVLI